MVRGHPIGTKDLLVPNIGVFELIAILCEFNVNNNHESCFVI